MQLIARCLVPCAFSYLPLYPSVFWTETEQKIPSSDPVLVFGFCALLVFPGVYLSLHAYQSSQNCVPRPVQGCEPRYRVIKSLCVPVFVCFSSPLSFDKKCKLCRVCAAPWPLTWTGYWSCLFNPRPFIDLFPSILVFGGWHNCQ